MSRAFAVGAIAAVMASAGGGWALADPGLGRDLHAWWMTLRGFHKASPQEIALMDVRPDPTVEHWVKFGRVKPTLDCAFGGSKPCVRQADPSEVDPNKLAAAEDAGSRAISAYRSYKASPCNLAAAQSMRHAYKDYMSAMMAQQPADGADPPPLPSGHGRELNKIFLELQSEPVFSGIMTGQADGISQEQVQLSAACVAQRSPHADSSRAST